MSELSSDARNVLERGFQVDGPSAERRERVKGRVLVALGGGMAALGTAAGAAGAAGTAAASTAAGAGAKSLLGTSLFVWFATGVGAGLGVGGVAAVVQHVQVSETVTHVQEAPVAKQAPVAPPVMLAPEVVPGQRAEYEAGPVASPAVDPRARDRATSTAPSVTNEPGAAAPEPPRSAADPTSMSEEASLLQSAQRALSAGRAQAALSLLAEHELRFPSGALAEERRVAKVLALCSLGRTEEASILARAFVARSPRSVLIPRLETSCVGKSLVR